MEIILFGVMGKLLFTIIINPQIS